MLPGEVGWRFGEETGHWPVPHFFLTGRRPVPHFMLTGRRPVAHDCPIIAAESGCGTRTETGSRGVAAQIASMRRISALTDCGAGWRRRQ